MKELVNKFISNVHFFIVAYGLYAAWIVYDEHMIRMEELKSQFPSVELEIANNNKKIKEVQEFVKKAEESKVRVEEVAKNIEMAQKQLPSEINDNVILQFFNQEMGTLNIKDPAIIPGKEVTSTYYISKDYTVKAKGTFLQFLIFFERIGTATRIYNVKSLKLINADINQRGRFNMITSDGVIEAFRFNPDFKVDRGFETPPTP